jgi:hypothetical protein
MGRERERRGFSPNWLASGLGAVNAAGAGRWLEFGLKFLF